VAASSDDRGNERAGGGEAEAEERTDGWMTTYSDMVTLLLTFFVLMFALSNVDNEKAELFLFAMSRNGLTPEEFMEIRARYDFTDDDFLDSEWNEMFPAPDSGATAEDQGGNKALEELADAIGGYIDSAGLSDSIDLVFNGEFLMLTLKNDIWFESGRADITEEMKESAVVLAELLASTFTYDDPFEIVVAGHTDNVPIHTVQYPSNWHVSKDRATNFLEVLIFESGLDPGFFYARACGEYRPIASNDTEEGRRANRRVEVMIGLARENPLWNRSLLDQNRSPAD